MDAFFSFLANLTNMKANKLKAQEKKDKAIEVKNKVNDTKSGKAMNPKVVNSKKSKVKITEKEAQSKIDKVVKDKVKNNASAEEIASATEEQRDKIAKKNDKVEKERKERRSKILLLKAKALLLRVLAWVMRIIQSIVMLLISMFGTIGLIILLVIGLVLTVIIALSSYDFSAGGSTYNGPNGNPGIPESCVQGVQILDSSGLSIDANPAFTDKQKNLYRFYTIYNEALSGGLGATPVKKDFIDSVGMLNYLYFSYGFSAVETGFRMYADSSNNRNILEDSSDIAVNSAGYAFLGLKATWDMRTYAESKLPSQDIETIISNVKSKYVPKTTYSHNGQIVEGNYAPYGVIEQLFALNAKMLYVSSSSRLNDTKIDSIMDAYNVTVNREELRSFIYMFGSAAGYHSGQGWFDTAANLDSFISMMCAIWTASAESPENMHFYNYAINQGTVHDEGTARKYFLGPKNCYMTWDSAVSDYITVNGNTINTTVWTYVRDNCSNKQYFMDTVVPRMDELGGKAGILNYHYGFVSYLTGKKVLAELNGGVPEYSSQSVNSCDCGNSSSAVLFDGEDRDFSNVRVGEVQGNWSPEVMEYLNSHEWKKYFGSAPTLTTARDSKIYGSTTYENWRLSTSWKMPYYRQREDPDPAIHYGKVGNTAANNNACGLYMTAHILSRLTGRVINMPEAYAAAIHLGGVQKGTGLYMWIDMGKVYANLGLMYSICDKNGVWKTTNNNSVVYPDGTLQEKVDKLLEAGGIVGIFANNYVNGKNSDAGVKGVPYTNATHFFVISEKTSDGKYYTIMASKKSFDESPHTWEEIVGKNGYYLNTDYAIIFGYNPNSTFDSNTIVKGNVICDPSDTTANVTVPDIKSLTGGGSITYTDYTSLTQNAWGTRSTRDLSTIKYIVIHHTAGNADVEGHVNMYKSGTLGAEGTMAQYMVRDNHIGLVAPDNVTVYHGGGGETGKRTDAPKPWGNDLNAVSVGIEMCTKFPGTDDQKCALSRETILTTLALVKYLMETYNIPPENVYRHYDNSLKNCPQQFLDTAHRTYGASHDNYLSKQWVAFKDALVTGTMDFDALAGVLYTDTPTGTVFDTK